MELSFAMPDMKKNLAAAVSYWYIELSMRQSLNVFSSSLLPIEDVEMMPKTEDAAPTATTTTTTGRVTGTPVSVESLSSLVMDCGVYLPGCRHRGRALLVADLSLLRSHLPPVSHLAQLVAYYQTVPRKSAAKNGLVLLVAGRPDQFPKAFELIQQLVCHFHVRTRCSSLFINETSQHQIQITILFSGKPTKVYRRCRHLERRRGRPGSSAETLQSIGIRFVFSPSFKLSN